MKKYIRYQNNRELSSEEKIELVKEYFEYYEELIKNQNIEVLNKKIPRQVFSKVLDQIGALLKSEASEMVTKDVKVKQFLTENPLPDHMKDLLPDDFRVFSLLLNSLKQWVSAESYSTDKYLLGGAARNICKNATGKCIVMKRELGNNPELHHPIRDGRPPIILSKEGHILIERNYQRNNLILDDYNESDEIPWNIIVQIRNKKRQSWDQLREGLIGAENCRPGAKSFARKVVRETGLSKDEIIKLLDKNKKGL